MIRSRQWLSAIATAATLALVLAGVANASSAPADTYSSHKPVSGNYPGSYTPAEDTSIWVATQRHPAHKPLSGNYPGSYAAAADASTPVANHKPLRGDYRTGSYTSTATASSDSTSATSDTFDWGAAGVGAATMLGLVLLLIALKAGLQPARRNRARVLEVPDNRPSVS
jgi:hypothetical protein